MAVSEINAPASTVSEWLDAFDADSQKLDDKAWGAERLRRLHGQQMALDVIAHVQNIPLRLLRLNSLKRLDETFVRFVDAWESEIYLLLTDKGVDGSMRSPRPLGDAEAKALIAAMKVPAHLVSLREWVLQLASAGEDHVKLSVPADLPAHYAEWFLTLLPHLERDVWLSEMGNPLPVHNLTRMVEHWALYVLMWAWSNAETFQSVISLQVQSTEDTPLEPPILGSALGMKHLGLIVMPAYDRRGRSDTRPAVLLVGPFLRAEAAVEEDVHWYLDPLDRYLKRIERVENVEGWREVREKAPGATELRDALEARAGIDDYEAVRRAGQSLRSFRLLLKARIDPTVMQWESGAPGRPISRANWETMAALAAWYDRWGQTVATETGKDDAWAMHVTIKRHRVSLLAEFQPGPRAQQSSPSLTFVSYGRQVAGRIKPMEWRSGDDCIASARADRWRWIEGPDTFFARMRERQQAAWTSHIAAIDHLLARHSRSDRPEGADNPDARKGESAACEEADHLLRGYGGRVCRYLLGMARADVAVIYWLDYGENPPRLRHVGGAERLVQHRAKRQSMLSQFDQWSRVAGTQGQPSPASGGADSAAQVYRVASTGAIHPRIKDRKARNAVGAEVPPPIRLKQFEDPQPLDALSVPLLFNDRVVGVFGLAGIASERHFESRLYPALRLVAQTLAQAMYFHSQVWQMRQLNWLASHVPLEQWRKHRRDNEFNPLMPAARCLANIFLCPVVQIWLRDRQNRKRFKLHGNTLPALYRSDGEAPEHAPTIYAIPSREDAEMPLTRPFLAFAVDQWPTVGEATNAAPGDLPPTGQFVQGSFDEREPATLNYRRSRAEDGRMILGKDFVAPKQGPSSSHDGGVNVEDIPPGSRSELFVEHRLAHIMAFSLVNPTGTVPDVVGVVTLHSRPQSGNGEHLAWPPGWRPVVAHVQTYLPYVLMQTETIANPLDNLRRYLLHEGRNELNKVTVLAGDLKALLTRLIAPDEPQGHVRPWLRQVLPDLERRHLAQSAGGDSTWLRSLIQELGQTERLITDMADRVDRLLDVQYAENLAILGRMIEHQRDISSLGLGARSEHVSHRTKWISVRQSLQDEFSAYWKDLRLQGIYWSVDKIPENFRLLTQERIWSWVTGDLVHNIAKYAAPNSAAQVTFESITVPDGGRMHYLRFINESIYDPELDQSVRLVQIEVQGSAGKNPYRRLPAAKVSRQGMGIGLWGVDQLAVVLGLRLKIDIKPLSPFRDGTPRALYSFNLEIPPHLIRR